MEFVSLADLFEAKKKLELRTRDKAKDNANDDKGEAARVVRDKRKPKKPMAPKDRGTDDAVQRRIAAQEKRKKTILAKQKQAQKKAADDNRAARQARIAQIRKMKEPEKPVSISSVPAQIAHCMMAVHLKRGKSKRAAWNICRWAMTKYGYLKGPYRINDRLPKTTAPTSKGTRRNFQHGMEKGPLNGGVKGTGASKYKKFVRLFKDLEPQIIPKQT